MANFPTKAEIDIFSLIFGWMPQDGCILIKALFFFVSIQPTNHVTFFLALASALAWLAVAIVLPHGFPFVHHSVTPTSSIS